MKFNKILAIPLLLLVVASGCKKDFLETKPSDAVTATDIFSSTANVQLYVDGAFKLMYQFAPNGSTRHDNFGQKGWDLSSDLMGTDMVVNTQGYGWFNASYQYTEWLQPTAGRHPDNAWYFYYAIVGKANTILANIETASGTQSDKEYLKGQAYGLRAYAYFYLINYWAQTYKGHESDKGVPIYPDLASTLAGGNSRGTVQQVYDFINDDLAKATTLLTGKTRANKVYMDMSVINGFKARVALIQENWAAAATAANAARQGYSLFTTSQYTSRGAFSTISGAEWMWGSLIPSTEATIYASYFSHMDIATGGYAALGGQKKITKALYDQIPAGDVRKTRFKTPGTGTTADPDYDQHKFEVPSPGSWAADYLYMRVSEMYLIEAEALARQGQDAAARTVLETLVKARNPAYSAASFSGTTLISEIMLQRRIEMWGEGFSLIDIKRWKTGLNRPTGAGNHGSPNFNPAVYTLPDADPKFLMRIPQSELDLNGALTPADQNP
jgi:starch-binding outer membrane protein, SusD/RagB family